MTQNKLKRPEENTSECFIFGACAVLVADDLDRQIHRDILALTLRIST